MADDALCPRCQQPLGLDGMCLDCPEGTEKLPPPPPKAAPPPRQVGGIMLLPMNAPAPPPPPVAKPRPSRMELEGPNSGGVATFDKVDGKSLELDEEKRRKPPQASGRNAVVVDAPAPRNSGRNAVVKDAPAPRNSGRNAVVKDAPAPQNSGRNAVVKDAPRPEEKKPGFFARMFGKG